VFPDCTDQFGQSQLAVPERFLDAVFHDPALGSVSIWDHGNYEFEEWTTDRITFTLHGSRVAGRFTLVRPKHDDPRNWLLIKRGNA
jgi:hypothetical protein